MAFTNVTTGDTIEADHINDIHGALNGTAGKAQVISITEVDDAANYALSVKNKDTTNSLIARFLNAAGAAVLSVVKEAVNVSKQIVSTVATGTAPFVVASATKVDNLYAARAALADEATTVTDGSIDADALAANAVDDTKAGNRVPQFRYRQGGSAGEWSANGTTSYQLGAVRMQAGSAQLTLDISESLGQDTITFPEAFSEKPLVFCTVLSPGNGIPVAVALGATASDFVLQVLRTGTTEISIVKVAWLAIGPE
jgi:hypothetical protein